MHATTHRFVPIAAIFAGRTAVEPCAKSRPKSSVDLNVLLGGGLGDSGHGDKFSSICAADSAVVYTPCCSLRYSLCCQLCFSLWNVQFASWLLPEAALQAVLLNREQRGGGTTT